MEARRRRLPDRFEVMAVDERGFAFIEKTWQETPDTSIGHGLYLAPDEMEVAA